MITKNVVGKLKAEELTSRQVVSDSLEHIATHNTKGQKINALLNVDARALELAAALDEERTLQGARTGLHGVPVVVKDTIEVAGMPYTLGHPILADFDPKRDAQVIQRLRNAGAIILGKTNLTDILGPLGDAESTIGGKCLNPYNSNYSPGGSSGGSAAAVAAGFAPLALGVDTGGSVLIPAADCGLVGMVATHGLVGRSGGLADSASLTRIGPIATSVADAATLLSVMSGWDPLDATTIGAIGRIEGGNFEDRLEERNVASFRLGVLRDLFLPGNDRQEGAQVVEMALAALKETGVALVDPTYSGINLTELVKREHSATNYHEYWHARDAIFATWPEHAPFHSVEELIDLVGKDNLKGTQFLDLAHPDSSKEYLNHLKTQNMMREALMSLIDELELDALVYPFSLRGPRKWDDRSLLGMEETALAAHTRLPAIVVPAGYLPGDRPIGLGFLGKPFSDLTLLQIAHFFENQYPVRREPNSYW